MILDNAFPSWSTLGIMSMLALMSLTIGSVIFFRLKDDIVDEV
jgi:hypothetical protein